MENIFIPTLNTAIYNGNQILDCLYDSFIDLLVSYGIPNYSLGNKDIKKLFYHALISQLDKTITNKWSRKTLIYINNKQPLKFNSFDNFEIEFADICKNLQTYLNFNFIKGNINFEEIMLAYNSRNQYVYELLHLSNQKRNISSYKIKKFLTDYGLKNHLESFNNNKYKYSRIS